MKALKLWALLFNSVPFPLPPRMPENKAEMMQAVHLDGELSIGLGDVEAFQSAQYGAIGSLASPSGSDDRVAWLHDAVFVKSFWKVEKASEKERALESELKRLRQRAVCDELMKHQLGEDLDCEKYDNVSLRRELAECRASRVCHCRDVKEEPKRKPPGNVLKLFLGPDAMMMAFMKQGVVFVRQAIGLHACREIRV